MFVLTEYTLDCEGSFNLTDAICVSHEEKKLQDYHKEKCSGLLIPDGSDLRYWCKNNGKDYYRQSNYYTISEINFLP